MVTTKNLLGVLVIWKQLEQQRRATIPPHYVKKEWNKVRQITIASKTPHDEQQKQEHRELQ